MRVCVCVFVGTDQREGSEGPTSRGSERTNGPGGKTPNHKKCKGKEDEEEQSEEGVSNGILKNKNDREGSTSQQATFVFRTQVVVCLVWFDFVTDASHFPVLTMNETNTHPFF